MQLNNTHLADKTDPQEGPLSPQIEELRYPRLLRDKPLQLFLLADLLQFDSNTLR